jgi:gamma-glutamylcyclotransferase (GGCT)/AIG2-like uncharacterized protein YtfP
MSLEQNQPSPPARCLPIFVYGTLMAAPLLAWVLTGSSSNSPSVLSTRKKARIAGFARRPVRHSDYPALLRAGADSVVHGFLVFPRDQSERNKLDNFEGEGETYKRTVVRAIIEEAEGETELEAHVYLWAGAEEALDCCEWDFEYFERERLGDWLELFGGIEMVG